MKHPVLTFVLALGVNFMSAQTPVTVTESTFKVSGMGEEILYYGFAAGDQILFDFEEANRKELKEIEISEYKGSSKFMDYKTRKVHNKTISVNSKGIYMFRFSNSAIGGRVCKVKIQRIPASEQLKNFNTTVYWETRGDTTYTQKQEQYLKRKEYVPKVVSSMTEYYVNSGSNALMGGRSRIIFPVSLPENTVEWYYQFSATRNKEEMNKLKAGTSLLTQISNIIDQTGTIGFAVSLLRTPPGGDVCDVYLLDHDNANLFIEKEEHKYFTAGTRFNLKSGTIQLGTGFPDNIYIGIRNPARTFGIHVAVEVVAIVLEEEWAERSVQIPSVST